MNVSLLLLALARVVCSGRTPGKESVGGIGEDFTRGDLGIGPFT